MLGRGTRCGIQRTLLSVVAGLMALSLPSPVSLGTVINPDWFVALADGCQNIPDKYAELLGPNGFLGQSVTEEQTAPDGVGRHQHFQGGSIYWSPTTCAHEVHGLIRDRWAGLG